MPLVVVASRRIAGCPGRDESENGVAFSGAERARLARWVCRADRFESIQTVQKPVNCSPFEVCDVRTD
jgi:hypothetical protein